MTSLVFILNNITFLSPFKALPHELLLPFGNLSHLLFLDFASNIITFLLYSLHSFLPLLRTLLFSSLSFFILSFNNVGISYTFTHNVLVVDVFHAFRSATVLFSLYLFETFQSFQLFSYDIFFFFFFYLSQSMSL